MLHSFAGGRLFGSVTGTGPPSVLALHGWGRTHRDFDAVLAPPGEPAVDAVALDLPGFGASPAPVEPWGPAEYAAAVAEVLPAMGAPVVVLGHSFGGRVAVHLAAGHAEQVAAVVLTGAPVVARPGRRRRPPARFRVARALHRAGLVGEARMEDVRRRYGSADYRAASGVMRQVLVEAVGGHDEAQLAALRCPVALVWGDDDTDVPPQMAEAAAELVPTATITWCPGAGHLTPLTAPGELRRAVRSALGARP